MNHSTPASAHGPHLTKNNGKAAASGDTRNQPLSQGLLPGPRQQPCHNHREINILFQLARVIAMGPGSEMALGLLIGQK